MMLFGVTVCFFFSSLFFLHKFASSAPSATMPPPSPDLPPSNDALGTSKQAQTMTYDVVWAHGMFFFSTYFTSSAPSAMMPPPSPDLPPLNNALGTSKQAQTMYATSLPQPPPLNDISGTSKQSQTTSNNIVWAHGMFLGYVIFDRHHFSTHSMHFWPPQCIFNP